VNILLTTSAAPQKSPFFTKEKRPPLGLGFLISILRDKGHTVFFIDNYLSPSNFIEEGYLQKNKIDFVGIHANTICYRDTLRMFHSIENLRKKNKWNGKIVVGGPHTSVSLDSIPEFVDYIVQGEGEKAIVDILEGKENKKVIRKERIMNLDILPFQPWDIFSKMSYDHTCQWLDVVPVFTMNTSRGCPFNCTFCSVGSIWGKGYTCFSAERIIDEICYLKNNFNAKAIYFREDNFTMNRKRTKDFCAALRKKNIGIYWACETRVDSLNDEETVKMMSTSGCRAVYLGVESGSQEILNILNKGITVEQIERAIYLCKKYEIRTYCSLIAGTPGETYKDYLLTVKLMNELKPHSYSFNVFVGIPNSPLYKYVLKNNLYEYIDDLGLVYLPGFDIKAEFFYKMDSKMFVDYDFKKRTDLDRKLSQIIKKKNMKNFIYKCLRKIVPNPVKNFLKKFLFLRQSL
jgi:O-antigen biosynthesis protein